MTTKAAACQDLTDGVTETWEQDPMFVQGHEIPFPSGKTCSQDTLSYVNSLCPQKQWRIGGGAEYYVLLDGSKVVRNMYLVCVKSGTQATCVPKPPPKEEPQKAPSFKRKKQTPTAPLEGRHTSKCGCHAQISIIWTTPTANAGVVSKCKWQHSGRSSPALLTVLTCSPHLQVTLHATKKRQVWGAVR